MVGCETPLIIDICQTLLENSTEMDRKSAPRCIGILFAAIFLFLLLDEPLGAQGGNSRNEIALLFPSITPELLENIAERGSASNFLKSGEKPILVPTEKFGAKIGGDLDDLSFTIGVEVLHVLPDEFANRSTEELASLLLEISDLAGLEYYSASKDRMRILFFDSYFIDSLDTKIPIDDPIISSIPTTGSMYAYQEDNTFGKNYNTIGYDVQPGTIHMITENISTYRWGLVPIVRPKNLHLHVLIYRTENQIIYYGNFGARALRVGLIKDRIHNSFYNRLMALYGWYHKKLAE